MTVSLIRSRGHIYRYCIVMCTCSASDARHHDILMFAGSSGSGRWVAAVPAASALSILPPISEAPRLARLATSLVSIACSAAPPAVAELAADSAAAILNRAPTGLLLTCSKLPTLSSLVITTMQAHSPLLWPVKPACSCMRRIRRGWCKNSGAFPGQVLLTRL